MSEFADRYASIRRSIPVDDPTLDELCLALMRTLTEAGWKEEQR